MAQHTKLPTDLPVPVDDGACDHLPGKPLPDLTLSSTGGEVNLAPLTGIVVLFCYPRTAAPGETVPTEWNLIPGARGCTPQACSFRDAAEELKQLGVSTVFGVSTQNTSYHEEAKSRLHLPYELLSDEHLRLAEALNLPTFEWQGGKLLKRVTLIVRDGRIEKVFYPVFPTNASAAQVAAWLREAA